MFHQFMGPRQVQEPELVNAVEANAAMLLLRLLKEPGTFMTHARQ